MTAGRTTAVVKGLKSFAPQDRPPVPPVFLAFRIMAALGLAMIVLGLWGAFLCWRSEPERSRPYLRTCVLMGPAGFVAVLAGWITTETGRQPFTVYGLLRTADSASPIAAPAVGSSLIAFAIVYFAVFVAGVVYLLRLMAQPPHPGEQGPSSDLPARAAGITPAIERVRR